MKINPVKTGLSLGLFLGTWHLIWIVLVLIGVAQPLLELVFSLHFLNNPFTVQALSFWLALLLVLITSVIGYCIGWLFSVMWNYFHE